MDDNLRNYLLSIAEDCCYAGITQPGIISQKIMNAATSRGVVISVSDSIRIGVEALINFKLNRKAQYRKSFSRKGKFSANRNPTIFISYSWADRDTVNEIDHDLSLIGLKIVRDIRETKDYHSIKDYMTRIRDEDFALIIISDHFLKSENCLYEILEFIKDTNYKDRIVPIIIKNNYIDFFSTQAKIEYTNYWKRKFEELEFKSKNFSPDEWTGIADDFKHLRNIRTSIGDFLDTIRDIKTVPLDELRSTNYRSLLEKVGFEGDDLIVELLKIAITSNIEEQDIAISEFIKSHPSYYLAYAILGDIEFSRNNFRKALIYYTEAINLNSENEILFNDRGITYYKLREYDKAINDYDQAIKLNPQEADYYFGRGSTLDELEKYNEALDDYNRAIGLNPHNDRFYNNRGTTFFKLGRYELALKDYDKYLEINPDNKSASLNRKAIARLRRWAPT